MPRRGVRVKSGLLLAGLALLAAPAHAQLTSAERLMKATVEAEQQRTLGLLERMVNQNSGSQNPEGVEKVAEIVRGELEPLGFAVRWIPLRETGRAGHLVASRVGRAGTKKLLLIGHLDTVFEPDSPFQRWVREGDKGHGPGAADDKGGVAVMIAALRAMQAAGTLRNSNVTVFLTGDEEDPGTPQSLARRDLIAAGKAADVALDFEGLAQEDGRDMGSIARRSVNDWQLTIKANSAHSSGVFSAASGYGANYELARLVDAFRREVAEPSLTFNVGLIAGGTTARLGPGGIRAEVTGKTNIIAGEAVARGDLRALSQEQIDRAKARMQVLVAKPLAGVVSATLTFEDGYPPMAPTAGNRALLDRLNGINRDLGLPAMAALDPLKRGAGDISFVAADVDGLVGLGPSSSGDHTDQERVDIPSMSRQATRAAILMSRLGRERR
ncbi:M20/M25/M40 family metallo-hydrolase [Sphingomonas swuensis]|uniref:M20/M25/M40 family metallo-hydrolase n=1 Tax=Sphingomonas swuensis TaxID=977800 RepID=UPI003CD08203